MISILIPINNGIEYIDESVNSVLEQTYQDWELLIGINGHKPNSIEYRIAKEYENVDNRIRVFDMHDIQGKANTLNSMVENSKYDWISILDVDDIWFPTKLEKQIPLLDSYDVVGTQCVYFENMEGINPKIPFGDIGYFDFKIVNPIINSSAILRKNLAKWRTDGAEDYDLWLRLRFQKNRFYNIEEVLVKHRIHDKSAFNNQDLQEKIANILKEFDSGYGTYNSTDDSYDSDDEDEINTNDNNINIEIIDRDNE